MTSPSEGHSLLRLCDSVLVLLVLAAAPVHSQASTIRPVTVVARFPIDSDPLPGLRAFSFGAGDRIAVVDGTDRAVLTLNAEGRVLHKIGARGDGPGEYREASAVAWRHDSLLVFDRTARRISVDAPPTFPFLRSVALPTGYRVARMSFGGNDAVLTLRSTTTRVDPAEPPADAEVFVARFAELEQRGATALQSYRTRSDLGVDCVDARGDVHIIRALVRHWGALGTVSSTGGLIYSGADGRLTAAGTVSRVAAAFTKAAPKPTPITTARWDSLRAPVVAAQTKSGALTCSPPVTRPSQLPIVQVLELASATTVLTEILDAGRLSLLSVDLVSGAESRFSLPARDVSFPWSSNGGRIAFVTAGEYGDRELVVARWR